MNILIENFKNLKKLKYVIEDNKINFLFGLSGSGKSSIISAFADDEPNLDKMIGTKDDDLVNILLDGKHISPTQVHVFDIDKMNFILQETDISTFKEVILINDDEHTKLHENLEKILSKLSDALSNELDIYNRLNSLLDGLKITKLNKSGAIPNTSNFAKVMTKLRAFNKTRLFEEIVKIDNVLFDWRMKGVSLMAKDKCPFCEKKIARNKAEKLRRMSEFESKSVGETKQRINDNAALFGGVIAYNYQDMLKIEKQLITYFKAVKTYKDINIQVHDFFEEGYQYKTFSKIKASKEFKTLFPNTSKEYEELCKNISSLKSTIKNMQSKTDKFLKGKKAVVNDLFALMDIPYNFEVKYHRSGPNEYFICHKKNKDNLDDRTRMSEGERAMVSLVLFLVSSKYTDYKLYFIDDPVSSFDTYRRKIIFDLITKYLEGKTCIVLSHDPVFAKFAINITSEKVKRVIGSVCYLSNNGEHDAIIESVKDVSIESFGKSVIERCYHAKNQYEKAILVRMLFEEKCGHKSVIYSYLSKILHGLDYDEIMQWIANRKQNEADIVSTINSNLEQMGLMANYLSVLDPDYNIDIDITDFSVFEKCIIFRELVNKTKKAYRPMIRYELNNSVHLTEVLALGMNVFEFPIISRSLRDEIEKLPNVLTLG